MFEKNLNISLLLDFYGDILTERQSDMLSLYYNEDCSLAEIADTYSISRQGVRSVLKKAETILFDMENKLGLAARFVKMREKSTEIASELDLINKTIEYMKNNGVSSFYLGHCISDEVIDYFESYMPNSKVFRLAVGKKFNVERRSEANLVQK